MTPPKDREIQFVQFYFPHGVSIEAAQRMAQLCEGLARAGVSEGGMAIVKGNFGSDGPVEFSKDSMSFVFGHDRIENAKMSLHRFFELRKGVELVTVKDKQRLNAILRRIPVKSVRKILDECVSIADQRRFNLTDWNPINYRGRSLPK